MKEWKNKEVILGLIVIIILGTIAILLLIRREIREWEEWKNSTAVTDTIVNEQIDTEERTTETVALEQPTEVEPMPTEEIRSEENIDQEEVQSEESEAKESAQHIMQIKPEKDPIEQDQQIGLYTILGREHYRPSTLIERKIDDGQLKELFTFWDAYKMESVYDLLRLERIQNISASLDGTDYYYYYGSVDALGRPSGKGLAVYGNNTYYCGEWKEGLRSGEGMWMQVAIYHEENAQLNLGIMEHMYNGKWSKDLPNGQGQEHFSFDYEILDVEDKTIANVVGNFKDGYYHGEMYVMTTDSVGRTKDWNGNCRNGVWETLLEGNTTKGVWRSTEMNSERYYDYHYMFPQENIQQGIYGLKK